jgi:hypothetical protein
MAPEKPAMKETKPIRSASLRVKYISAYFTHQNSMAYGLTILAVLGTNSIIQKQMD